MNVPGKLIPVAVFATLPTLATAAAMDVDIPLPEPTVTGQWTKTLPMDKKIATMKYLGDLNDDLTFTPVTPCRLADTRNAGGALASFAARSFSATDATMINAAGQPDRLCLRRGGSARERAQFSRRAGDREYHGRTEHFDVGPQFHHQQQRHRPDPHRSRHPGLLLRADGPGLRDGDEHHRRGVIRVLHRHLSLRRWQPHHHGRLCDDGNECRHRLADRHVQQHERRLDLRRSEQHRAIGHHYQPGILLPETGTLARSAPPPCQRGWPRSGGAFA